MQKKSLFLFLILLLVVLYYFKSSRSSFGFGAPGDYLWPDPANGVVTSSQEPVAPATGTITGIPALPYEADSLTCYNAIPKTGWEGGSISKPLNDKIVVPDELTMFQNFMNNQPNIKAFMTNNTDIKPVFINELTAQVDTLKSNKLFTDLITASKKTSVTITSGTITNSTTKISLNDAVSIPPTITDPDEVDVNIYEVARANIIIGVLNALHFIYFPGEQLDTSGNLTKFYLPDYISTSNSVASTDGSGGYTPTPIGGKDQSGYVGIVQELYNNYRIDQPDPTKLTIGRYETYNGIQLALTPNVKHAVWVYLRARDAWIDDIIYSFSDTKDKGYLSTL